MKLISLKIPEQQIDRLRDYKDETGISVSELIRRAIDRHYPPREHPQTPSPEYQLLSS